KPERGYVALGFRYRFAVSDADRSRGAARVPRLTTRGAVRSMNLAVTAILSFFPEAAKDHLTRSRLQHTGHCDISVFADQSARIVYDHHGAIVQISDTLVVFFAFLQDEYSHCFTRQYDRLERISQLVDVQHTHATQLRDLVQVEIVSDDYCVELFAQFN